MQCHTPTPFPNWRPTTNKMPWLDDMPLPADLDDDPELPTPEPPEYGPAPHVVLN